MNPQFFFSSDKGGSETEKEIVISQQKYIMNLLKETRMISCKIYLMDTQKVMNTSILRMSTIIMIFNIYIFSFPVNHC